MNVYSQICQVSLHIPLLSACGDCLILFTLLHLPVHDVANQRTCGQTQQL